MMDLEKLASRARRTLMTISHHQAGGSDRGSDADGDSDGSNRPQAAAMTG